MLFLDRGDDDGAPGPVFELTARPGPFTSALQSGVRFPHDRHLVEEGGEGSVRIRGPRELHGRAGAIIRPHFDRGRKDALETFPADPTRAAGNPGSRVLAALEGRVDTLFVAEEPAVWGTHDAAVHTVRTHPER